MRIRIVPSCLAMVFAMALLVPSIHADWTEGGVELSSYPSDQTAPQIISDGSGGAIVVWVDDREGSFTTDIFAQRFDSGGNVLWAAGGVNISELGSDQEQPVLVTDGAGGAIIAYQSNRTGDWNIIAQRIRSNGSLAWPAGGLNVCGSSGTQNTPRIVSDDTGGAIITWADSRSGDYNIYAARIDSTGGLPWTYNGVAVCQFAGEQFGPEITTDGSSGAIISWIDQRGGNRDIYIQLILFNGSTAWASNGEPVETTVHDMLYHRIISDMNGGAIVTWDLNYLSLDFNIYAERILNNGTAIWDPGFGVAVSEYSGDQNTPVMVSDGAGGAVIAWVDSRNGPSLNIYAQQIDYAGGANWIRDGTPICTDDGFQYHHEITSDGHGGAIILWADYRASHNREIYAQKIASNGYVKWQENGMNLTRYPADQDYAKVLATGDGGFIATWQDTRDLTNEKVYAQIFDGHGYWGDPAPVIANVSDVPADQGGKVQITWAPARMDAYPEELITHYTIWRSLSAPAAIAMMDEGAAVMPPGAVGLDFEGTAYRFDIPFGAAAAWEWVASVEAHYWEKYAYTCATLQDSSGCCDGINYFVISAHTADPFIFWDSDPDSGYSVDNLAPCAPMGIAGEQSYVPEGLELSWSPNSEADLGGYNIYRGTDPAFEPAPGNRIATTCDTLVFDGEWSWDSGFCYKVAAVDIHGNESGYAVLCAEQVTGDDPMPQLEATFLAQNFPNPFNPVTTIAFGLAERSPVTLRIYDPAGRLIRELVNGTLPAGHHSEKWDGLSDRGAKAASGVYFYRLKAGTFAETKKMILLK